MKKVIAILIITMVSCNQAVDTPTSEVDFPYEPTYQKHWKIGSEENTLLVQNFHKAIMDGNVDEAYKHMSDSIVIWHGDGSTTENLSAFKEKYDEILRSGVFQDYSVGVNISVVSEDGHEWVLVWDTAKVAGEDIRYQEAFRIEEGKIIALNQFSKVIATSPEED